MARKSAVPGLPAASDLTLEEFLAIYPPLAGAEEPDPEVDPPEPDPEPEPAAGGDDLETWKGNSRKHEREAKKARKERDDALAALKEKDDAEKSEHQKAVDAAREEGKAEALTEAEKERRSDRLEVQVTRIAAKGVTVGDKTLRFADTDDALLRVERAISRGDIESDDIFDSEGKVQTDALATALKGILEAAPHLAAGDTAPRSKGSSDAGKGAGSTELSDDPDEHFRRKRENK